MNRPLSSPADHLLFDRSSLRRNRINRRTSKADFLVRRAQAMLLDRLSDIKRSFDLALHIGLNPSADVLSPSIKTCFHMDLSSYDQTSLVADEEYLPVRPESLNLVISPLALHTVNDLPGALLQIRQSLKPDGLFIAALLGEETLFELKQSLMQTELIQKNGVSPRVHPMTTKQQMGALLQRAGFALPVVDSERITVTYETMFHLLHDLRSMGETNILQNRNRRHPGRSFFTESARYYHEHFSDPDGRIRATFDMIFLLGWAPHDSQQKPLRPGSAQKSLKDIL